MFWSDKVAEEIIKSKKHQPYWVDDMFTPSGFAHVGSLRGPLVHDVVYRSLKDNGQNATWTYIINDFDPIDGLPPELMDKFEKYLGVSLRMVPSPEEGFDTFADFFSKDIQKTLKTLGVEAKFLSSFDMYKAGKFNDAIKTALDNSEKILDIYQKISGSKKREKGWLPLQVICENCGKLGTTRVHDWDGKTVGYTCEPEMVKWAKGCGHTGRISPFDGNGKLPWKVDWPAHWKVLGVTIEGAGKDHSSAGGSRDIAKALCDEVFHYPNPFNVPYEFFLIGGKKMASSKGLGLKARELTDLLPPEVGRFLFTRTDFKKAIEFDPVDTMAIPNLFDEYQKAADAYLNKSNEDLARSFELSQVGGVKIPPKTRFSVLAQWVQMPNMESSIKKEAMPAGRQGLEEWVKYAKVWLEKFAPESEKFNIKKDLPEEAKNLSEKQKEFLTKIAGKLEKKWDPEEFQKAIYEWTKELQIPSKEAFAAIYISLIGKDHGPKASWLILSLEKQFVQKRLKEINSVSLRGISSSSSSLSDLGVEDLSLRAEGLSEVEGDEAIDTNDEIARLPAPASPHAKQSEAAREHSDGGQAALPSVVRNDKKGISSNIFSIDQKLKEKFPSISVGVAIIKGVEIQKVNSDLEREKAELLSSFENLTTEQINQFTEVISYRKLYKAIGIDWHSRRPSPEALLRRIALKKGLYTINTCVDAYNLVVMKNNVSVGAFDLDKISFPTILRMAKEGEEILLLGDSEQTKYKEGEIAYFDETGGFNIDFNYRDAQRTAVQLYTKNLYINVDGIYDVNPKKVEEVLKEACDKIIKYCGGKLELIGVEKAT